MNKHFHSKREKLGKSEGPSIPWNFRTWQGKFHWLKNHSCSLGLGPWWWWQPCKIPFPWRLAHAHSQISLLTNPLESQKSNSLPLFCPISDLFRLSWQHFYCYNSQNLDGFLCKSQGPNHQTRRFATDLSHLYFWHLLRWLIGCMDHTYNL